MSEPTLSMPASLARRPQYNGLPIPFMSPIDAAGRPMFSIDDELLKIKVIKDRLCGLCGEPMGQWVGFIGEQANKDARIFQQPGMHVECLLYASQVCPYIANPGYQVRSKVPTNTSQPTVLINPEVKDDPRPERMLIYVTSEYKLVANGQGVAVEVAPCKKIIWIDRV